MITAEVIRVGIQTALKQFGSYSYFDKGPEEVMDLDAIVEAAKDTPAKELSDVLYDVRKFHHLSDKAGEVFVTSFLACIQDREDFEQVVDSRLSDLY